VGQQTGCKREALQARSPIAGVKDARYRTGAVETIGARVAVAKQDTVRSPVPEVVDALDYRDGVFVRQPYDGR